MQNAAEMAASQVKAMRFAEMTSWFCVALDALGILFCAFMVSAQTTHWLIGYFIFWSGVFAWLLVWNYRQALEARRYRNRWLEIGARCECVIPDRADCEKEPKAGCYYEQPQ